MTNYTQPETFLPRFLGETHHRLQLAVTLPVSLVSPKAWYIWDHRTSNFGTSGPWAGGILVAQLKWLYMHTGTIQLII